MNIVEIVSNMAENLINNNTVLANRVANDILKNEQLAQSYTMDELSQLIIDTAKLFTKDKNMAKIRKTGKKMVLARRVINGNMAMVEAQLMHNLPDGKIVSVYLKNGLRFNGRFKVWKKYNDLSKFVDTAHTENHFALYDFKTGDYRLIVKNNIEKIVANNLIIQL